VTSGPSDRGSNDALSPWTPWSWMINHAIHICLELPQSIVFEYFFVTAWCVNFVEGQDEIQYQWELSATIQRQFEWCNPRTRKILIIRNRNYNKSLLLEQWKYSSKLHWN
jgi:hypothetical protein